MQAETAASSDDNVAIMEGIGQFRQAGIGAHRGSVELGRALHAERLVRTFGIELAEEGIEALLLLQTVAARRAGGLLLEGQMHALMAAVLLRMPRLDALDGNAKPKPPHRELGEIEQGIGTGKGHAIVRADGERQATFAEQSFKGCNRRVFTR